MKKLILISIIFLSQNLTAQIHGDFVLPETISEDKVTTVMQTAIAAQGSYNTVIVTSEADLYNSENNGKYLAIRNNISLTANRQLATGATLVGEGGVITGSYTLTLDDSNAIVSKNLDSTIIDDDVTISGYTNPEYPVYLEWFGAQTHEDSPLYDNKKAIDNALAAGQHGYIYFNAGHYYKSVVENSRFTQGIRPNTTIYGANTHVIGMGKDKTRISALLNEGLEKSVMFVIREAPSGSFEHIWLEGDLLTTSNPDNEHRSGLTLENNSHDFQVLHCRLSHFTGDGLNAYSWDNFGEPTVTFEAGGINETSGVNESNTNTWRSNRTSISQQALTNGYGMFTGQGYGGYSTLSDFSYKMYWYDENDAFIGVTDFVYTYKDVPIPANATQYRTTINNPIGGVAPSGYMFRGLYHSKRVIVAYNEIDHNNRNGISNLQQEGFIIYNWFHDNGGRLGGPSYAIDQEDGYQVLSDVTIAFNVFENNHAGAITLRWVNTINIHNNAFKGNSSLKGDKSDINARESWNVRIHHNNLYNTDVALGRFAKFVDNYAETSKITMANVYTRCENNTLYNPVFQRSGDSHESYGESIIKGNTIIITRPLVENVFNRGLNIIDNKIDFRNGITMGTTGLFPNYATTDIDGYKDYWSNNSIKNAQGSDAGRGISMYPMDMDNSSFDEFLFVQGGIRQDITWRDNNYVKRIEFIANNTPFTTDGSDFKNFKIEGGTITAQATDITSTKGVITLPAIDLNVEIDGLTIDLTDSTVIDDIFNMQHNGYVHFKNCVFKTDASSTWNLNNTTMPLARFKGCEFINVTPTFRAGDVEVRSDIYNN